MNKKQLTALIKTEKEKNKDLVILAHNYQKPEILEIADYVGDSLDLSRKASVIKENTIVFCGVRFMAETAKILSPQKTVLLPASGATCPMACMITAENVLELKTLHPKAKVVCYVNSTAEVKAVSDACCTSSNALSVVNNIDAEEIIFIPDKNLGAYCQRFTSKKIILWNGFCYVHNSMSLQKLLRIKKVHPRALVLAHPECGKEIIDSADHVLSTNGMLELASKAREKDFIIATETGLLYRLRKENPSKHFYALDSADYCYNMKKTSLLDVYLCLKKRRTIIVLDDEIMKRARLSLQEMLKYA